MPARGPSDPYNMDRRHPWLPTQQPERLASDILEWAMAAALVIVAAIAVLGAIGAR